MRLFVILCFLVHSTLVMRAQKDEVIEEIGDHSRTRYTASEFQKKFGPLLLKKIDVGRTVKRITDSLHRAGVDTFFVYELKYITSNTRYMLRVNNKLKDVKAYPQHVSNPSYIFWIRKGEYYIKKVDEFCIYKANKRDRSAEYAVYDFYYRNRKKLTSEKIPVQVSDTLGYEVVDSLLTRRKKPLVSPLPMDFYQVHYDDYRYQDQKRLRFYDPRDSMTVTLDTYMYTIAATPGKKEGRIFANDDEFYYRNLMLYRVLWTKLIESELFELESRHLWEAETPVSIFKLK